MRSSVFTPGDTHAAGEEKEGMGKNKGLTFYSPERIVVSSVCVVS
jgi:hypothetical protein